MAKIRLQDEVFEGKKIDLKNGALSIDGKPIIARNDGSMLWPIKGLARKDIRVVEGKITYKRPWRTIIED